MTDEHPLDAVQPTPRRVWTKRDIDAIERARKRGLTWRQIAKSFGFHAHQSVMSAYNYHRGRR